LSATILTVEHGRGVANVSGVGIEPGEAHPKDLGGETSTRLPGDLGAEVYRGIGRYAGVAFEDLSLQPGEVRDLGDIRTKAPVDVRGQ
jgi:hypothetical protein